MSRMASPARAKAAWIVPAICATPLLAAVLWEGRTDSGVLADVEVLANVPLSIGFAVVGALIVVTRPGNRLGLLYLGVGDGDGAAVFVYAVRLGRAGDAPAPYRARSRPLGCRPGCGPSASPGDDLGLLLYPDGLLPSPAMGWPTAASPC